MLARSAKKLRKCLAVSWKMRTFAPVGCNPPAPKIMTNKTTYYCITGVSRLSGEREELTGPMEKEQAQARLERYKENTKWQKYPTYTRVRVEQLLPVQLRLPFEPNK